METPRQDKSSLNMLHVEVYVADWESKKWLTYHMREPQKHHLLLTMALICLGHSVSRKRDQSSREMEQNVLCLASRAVHIEVTHQIDTDSFIQALQKMM